VPKIDCIYTFGQVSVQKVNSINQSSDVQLTQDLRPLNLARNFTMIMLFSMITASILLSISTRLILVNNLIKSEELNSLSITQLLSNSVLLNFEEFLNQAGSLSANEIRQHSKTIALNDFIQKKTKGLNILKIKIYNLDGYTIFSSDFSQIGKSKKNHPSFLKAVKGNVISKLSFRDKIYAQKELITNRNLISSYIPIWIEGKDEIQGVFEVYKDVTNLIYDTKTTQIKIFAIVFGILSIVFIVLYFVINNADKIIKEFNQQKEEETEQIKNMAFYDSLTGLPNRVLFLDRLEHSLQLASRTQRLVVLMFLDLDRFKQVNDNLGHEAGDTLLKIVTERLQKCVRTGDTLSRISGDEFTILVENIHNIEISTTIAQRIVSSIAKPYFINNSEVYITCSIGLSVYPFNDDDANSLMKKSDAAMFYSKSCGRNNFHYYTPDMLQHGSHRFELESDLSAAIETSQFQLYFQPKVSLSNLKMSGMEVLLRWEHPSQGSISPDIFLPILEETGLIAKVGTWVIQESCRLTKEWNDKGETPISVSVNVSAIQFNQQNFVSSIETILLETGLNPGLLELELTERCLMENTEENIEVMTNLKQLGVKLTIDDFGTGYSSLNYICRLPIDALKIDRSFISNLMDSSEKRSVVTAIISFAHGLKLNIVAEGIENLEQLTFVKAMRCTTAQGYLLSRPLSQDQFERMYSSSYNFNDSLELINAK